ncbi:MAG: terminase small subunit [gamma proteobacterium symbiont of Ctena orbiculata]|nr:MAG: terminase small subunit [gamma proteobacterium symbiont of Ctena orbiculata]
MSALGKLNQKQQRFCREYVIDFNGTRAAIAAGYSKKSARQTAHENLTKPDIQKALVELISERNDRLRMQSDDVLIRLVEEADAKFSDLLGKAGDFKDPEEWPEVWDRMISGYKVTTRTDKEGNVTVTREIKKNENPRRLELIGKHVDVKAFQERIAVEDEGWAERMRRAEKRRKLYRDEEGE